MLTTSQRVSATVLATTLLIGSLPSCKKEVSRSTEKPPSTMPTNAPKETADPAHIYASESLDDESIVISTTRLTYRSVTFSNGLKADLVMESTTEGGIPVHVVDTGYGEDYFMRVFDPGDGRPYVMDRTRPGEKRYKLTYTFEGTEYPIWEPTAFRSNPNYGIVINEAKSQPATRNSEKDKP